VWFYFLCTGCCSVAVGICETKGGEVAPSPSASDGIDYELRLRARAGGGPAVRWVERSGPLRECRGWCTIEQVPVVRRIAKTGCCGCNWRTKMMSHASARLPAAVARVADRNSSSSWKASLGVSCTPRSADANPNRQSKTTAQKYSIRSPYISRPYIFAVFSCIFPDALYVNNMAFLRILGLDSRALAWAATLKDGSNLG